MTQILAICNQKGGVAKTTTCLTLGACLVEAGYTTLVVDLDPQGSLTVASGGSPDEELPTISDLLADCQSGGTADVLAAIRPTSYPGMSLIAADEALAVMERELFGWAGYETLLRRLLDQVESKFDFILIDCSPSLGALTIMALSAARHVLVPVHCDYLAAWGVMRLTETIEAVRAHTNQELDYSLLVTMYDGRSNISREMLARLKDHFGARLLDTQIGTDTRLRESVVSGQAVIVYAPRTRAAQQYRALAQECLTRFQVGEKV